MDLKDFVKAVAMNLTRDNVDKFKQQAASLIMDTEMSIEDLSKLVNSSIYYEDILNMFATKKDFVYAVKRVMTETDNLLVIGRAFYRQNKKCFSWFNKITKDEIASPNALIFSEMTDTVIDYWLDNADADIFKDSSKMNHFYNVINTEDKKLITKVINHKNFKKIPSYYPLVSLLTTLGYEKLLTKTIFNKVFNQLIALMKEQQIELIDTLTNVVQSPFIELKHIEMLPTEQQIHIYEYTKQKAINISDDIAKFFYDITGDVDMLPSAAKNVFVF